MPIRSIVALLLLFLMQGILAAQCNYCLTSETVKSYSNLLEQQAPNKLDRKGRRTGIWDFSVSQNVHYGNYYSIDTAGGRNLLDTGIILARGKYKKGKPYGTWIKYMRGMDDIYTEYFFYEKGLCYKHLYHDRHNGWWVYDSLNKTCDTLIHPHISPGESDISYSWCGQPGNFQITDKYLLPLDACTTMSIKHRDNWTMTRISDSSSYLFWQEVTVLGDTTIVRTNLNDGTYREERYLDWPENKVPFQTRRFRYGDRGDIEIKE